MFTLSLCTIIYSSTKVRELLLRFLYNYKVTMGTSVQMALQTQGQAPKEAFKAFISLLVQLKYLIEQLL